MTPWGRIAWQCWDEIPVHFPRTELDAFVVMPNHVHGILVINDEAGAQPISRAQHAAPLHTIVRSYKSAVTKRIHERRPISLTPVWQRNYYERVIRNEDELNRIRQYILENPLAWETDRENPRAQVIEAEEPWQV